MIRLNPNIKGVSIDSINLLLSMFVDDINIFLPNNVNSWLALKSTIAAFENISGLKVNYDKTSVYRISSLGSCKALMYAMKKLFWSEGPINILGFLVDNDAENLVDINMEPIIKKAEKVTDMWKIGQLSLIGSITIFNSLVSSMFVYRLRCIPSIPNYWIKCFNKLVRDFIWRSKKPKIALKLLQGRKDEGGLGLCDIRKKDQSLKMQWIFQLSDNKELKCLAYLDMNNILGDWIWQIQLKKQDIDQLKFLHDSFCTGVLKVWCENTYQPPISKIQVKNQILWFNSEIYIANRLAFYSQWFEKGIIKV